MNVPTWGPWQASLFASPTVAARRRRATPIRTLLDPTSWVDHAPSWVEGADELFERLLDTLPWRQREVTMWERRLPEPRLTAWWDGTADISEPDPVLTELRRELSESYDRPFDTIGFNLYRDGNDSVAWHGDRERFGHEDPTVAIVSLGTPRPFRMRPRGGGPGRTWHLGHGDLLVMGGACQHDWEHCVPKVARPCAPRLSVMFRHHLGQGQPASASSLIGVSRG